jgi:hypothetical protein
MNLKVVAAPIQLFIAQARDQLRLSWTGGVPPYQVQTSSNLAPASWINFGDPQSNTLRSVFPTNTAAWFRIKGQ